MNKKVKTPKNWNIKKCKLCFYISGDYLNNDMSNHATHLYEPLFHRNGEENKICPFCHSRLVKAPADEILNILTDRVNGFKASCKKSKSYLTALEELELKKLTSRLEEVKKMIEG